MHHCQTIMSNVGLSTPISRLGRNSLTVYLIIASVFFCCYVCLSFHTLISSHHFAQIRIPFTSLSGIEVWQEDFRHLLRIRKQNHHARCNQCIRHRMIIRKLGNCLPARRAQVAELQKHLRRQYADRQVYWHFRSLSRLAASSAAPTTVTAIIDSMDCAKHSWPKAQCMSAKEFASWPRPKLSSTTLLIHGFVQLTVMSPHFVSSNSSRTIEILSHGLSALVADGYDLRSTHLVLQGDNASKELKNNSVLQWAASQVALMRVHQCTLSFLTSGHSHEDIDAYFAVVSQWLDRFPELHTVGDFQRCLTTMLDNKQVRPCEPHREVCVIDRFRDWTHS